MVKKIRKVISKRNKNSFTNGVVHILSTFNNGVTPGDGDVVDANFALVATAQLELSLFVCNS